MPSPEHQFLVQQLNQTLHSYAATALFGVAEAERKKFDYGCVLLRDMSRPLVAQVLWSHKEGIEKDLRTLLHDSESMLKVYLFRDTIPNRIRIDEILRSYMTGPAWHSKQAGLRFVPVRADFDADDEQHQQLMSKELDAKISNDVLFGIVFGRLSAHDFNVFAEHNGPFGLKYAMLEDIAAHGLSHMPTFKKRLGGVSSGPISQALAMLLAGGFIRRVVNSTVCIPTLKGRLMLDLSRRFLYEAQRLPDWTPEMRSIFGVLNVRELGMPGSMSVEELARGGLVPSLIAHCVCCEKEYGRNLLGGVDLAKPVFYSSFQWQRMFDALSGIPGVPADLFDEPESLFSARR